MPSSSTVFEPPALRQHVYAATRDWQHIHGVLKHTVNTSSSSTASGLESAEATTSSAPDPPALRQHVATRDNQFINQLHVFLTKGGNHKRGSTLKPAVVGTQPATRDTAHEMLKV
jgi:hypothetical protein